MRETINNAATSFPAPSINIHLVEMYTQEQWISICIVQEIGLTDDKHPTVPIIYVGF